MAPRSLVEETPRLDLAPLRRAGLFKGVAVVAELIGGEWAVRAVLEPDGAAVQLEWLDGVQRVELARRRAGFGEVVAFRAEDGAPCMSLYLADGRFQCRSALGLAYGNGAGRRLMLEIWTGDGMGVARQEIATAAGRRPGDLFLACPVTGRRVLKVYLREGRFASAQAQRLR